MPVRVEVPGHGIVEFPDGTAEDVMSKALSALATPSAPKPDLLGGGPAAMGRGDGAAQMVKDVTGVVKDHPATAGAMVAGLAAAPLTGGMSLPASMAVAGGLGAAGATAGNAVAGKPFSLGDAAREGITGAFGPVAGKAVDAAGAFLSSKALPLVRSALKPAVSVLKRQSGAAIDGIDGTANRVAGIVLKNRWSKPEHALQAVKAGETAVQNAVANAPEGVFSDLADRIPRYLKKLELSAGDSAGASRGRDVAAIKSATQDVAGNKLIGKDKIETTLVPSKILGPNGQPASMVPQEQVVGRELRSDVRPAEVLKAARATGRWDNRHEWGELKGAEQEVSKGTERALRDSLKTKEMDKAMPGLKPALNTQHQALTALPFLDQMANRAASRDAISLPAWMNIASPGGAAAKVAGGWMANSVRNNQLRAGFGAAKLGPELRAAAPSVAKHTPTTIRALLAMLGIGSDAPPGQQP